MVFSYELNLTNLASAPPINWKSLSACAYIKKFNVPVPVYLKARGIFPLSFDVVNLLWLIHPPVKYCKSVVTKIAWEALSVIFVVSEKVTLVLTLFELLGPKVPSETKKLIVLICPAKDPLNTLMYPV